MQPRPSPQKRAIAVRVGLSVLATLVLLTALFVTSRPALPATALPATASSPATAAPATSCSGTDPSGAICNLLGGDVAAHVPLSPAELADLQRFYTQRFYQPAWSGSPEADAQAQAALDAIRHADDQGLSPADYRVAELDGHARETLGPGAFDILLTQAVLHYAHDLRFGRIAQVDRDSDVNLPVDDFDAVTGLETALQDGAVAQFLAEQKPAAEQYARLAKAYAFYRSAAANGGWPTIAEGGATHRTETALLERLAAEDSALAGATTEDREAIAEALQRFQARNGLVASGRLDRETIASLNEPPEVRANVILANMERWRWMPHELGSRYIMVNVPTAELQVIDGDQVLLTSRVIAGKTEAPSPILGAEARGVIVNPPWNVPTNIARKEILPKAYRNPGYLRAHHFVWHDGGIEQLPGAHSALGRVKIDMPNDFNVYLHDTPGRDKFGLDKRHLSHGCIRVQEIVPLASIVLSGDPDSARDRIEEGIASGKTREYVATTDTPVYFAYWTAFVDDDGTVEFRADIYGRDARMLAILNGAQATRASLPSNG